MLLPGGSSASYKSLHHGRCLTSLSTIFQLHDDWFYWWTKPEHPEKIINMPPVHTLHSVCMATDRNSTHNLSGNRYHLYEL